MDGSRPDGVKKKIVLTQTKLGWSLDWSELGNTEETLSTHLMNPEQDPWLVISHLVKILPKPKDN